MRVPFPQSIPFRGALVVLSVVLLFQLIEGTDPVFAILMLIAQLATVVSFNLLGGIRHMAGAFCLFMVLPTVTVPELAHLILGQPGEMNLQHPIATAGVCAVFFLSVMIAALFASSIRHPEPYLGRIHFSILELRIVIVLSCIFAGAISVAYYTAGGPAEDGSLLAALNHFYPFMIAASIMLATYVRLETTNGRSCMSWYVAALILFNVTTGILGASKEGILTPIFCWLVVVAAARYRFSWLGTVSVICLLLLLWFTVYPFSQRARSPVREALTLSEKVDLVLLFFSDPSTFPEISPAEESSEFGVSTPKVNIVARYSLLGTIDMLIDADQKVGYTSIERYAPVLIAMVPHAIWPDRPLPISSNELGHKAGFRIDENNTETGIAIGGPALFFDVGGWLALIVYTTLCFSLFFLVALRFVGSADNSVWGLVPIGMEALGAGTASPGGMFNFVITFLGMFFLMIVILKIVGFLAKALISRPIVAKA